MTTGNEWGWIVPAPRKPASASAGRPAPTPTPAPAGRTTAPAVGHNDFIQGLLSGAIDPKPAEVKPPLKQEEPNVTPEGIQRLILDESSGKDYLKAYRDSRGISTIGHGFNLQEPSNHSIFEEVTGYKVADAIEGKVEITKEQQAKLLEHSISVAEKDARQLVPNFDKLRPAEQDGIVNFVFNVGLTTARKFKNTFKAINEGRGSDAAEGIKKSLYAKQVGPRAERVAAAISTIGLSDEDGE